MPDDRIKFSELSGVLTIDTNDIIAAAVQNGASETGFTSAKITIGQLSTKVAEGTTFSNLTTQNKYIVTAVNELKELISQIPQFTVQVVQTLPQTGITGTVYLVPSPEGSSPNLYEEYLWVSNQWEKLGSASVDLSNYYNKTQVNGLLADVFSASESYSVGDLVIYSDYLYRCIEATSGSWDSTKWSIVKLSFEIPRELGDLDNVNIQNPTHRQGLVYDNPTGKWINGSVGGSAESTSYDNTESGLEATNVQEAIDELEENIEGITEPQKTVSGSVVTFSDSLPNSPLLACKASIEAIQSGSGTPSPDNPRPITGYSEVKIDAHGKNLLPYPYKNADGTYGGVTVSTDANGKIHLQGQSGGSTALFRLFGDAATPVPPWIKGGKTYSLYPLGVSSKYSIQMILYGSPAITVYGGHDVTLPNDLTPYTGFAVIVQLLANTTYDDYIEPMIAQKAYNASEPFAPFKGSTHTIDLGQTVGRGVLNVTTGELTVTHKVVDLGSFNWVKSGDRMSTEETDAKMTASGSSYPDMLCEIYPIGTPNSTYTHVVGITVNNSNQRIFVYDGDYSDADAFKTAVTGHKVLYELATPVTVQLTSEEILTITENNISANSGDIEVTYRTPFYVSANSTSYDNSTSGLEATNVQEAIDELLRRIEALGGNV